MPVVKDLTLRWGVKGATVKTEQDPEIGPNVVVSVGTIRSIRAAGIVVARCPEVDLPPEERQDGQPGS